MSRRKKRWQDAVEQLPEDVSKLYCSACCCWRLRPEDQPENQDHYWREEWTRFHQEKCACGDTLNSGPGFWRRLFLPGCPKCGEEPYGPSKNAYLDEPQDFSTYDGHRMWICSTCDPYRSHPYQIPLRKRLAFVLRSRFRAVGQWLNPIRALRYARTAGVASVWDTRIGSWVRGWLKRGFGRRPTELPRKIELPVKCPRCDEGRLWSIVMDSGDPSAEARCDSCQVKLDVVSREGPMIRLEYHDSDILRTNPHLPLSAAAENPSSYYDWTSCVDCSRFFFHARENLNYDEAVDILREELCRACDDKREDSTRRTKLEPNREASARLAEKLKESGYDCPHCEETTRDAKYHHHYPHLESFFVCNLCARSYTPK